MVTVRTRIIECTGISQTLKLTLGKTPFPEHTAIVSWLSISVDCHLCVCELLKVFSPQHGYKVNAQRSNIEAALVNTCCRGQNFVHPQGLLAAIGFCQDGPKRFKEQEASFIPST